MEIKKRLICLTVFILIATFWPSKSFAVNRVCLDLSLEKSGGKIKVELLDLEFQREKEVLFFPSVIPGMYEKNDFGQYISNVYATLKDGKIQKLKRKNVNTFLLNDASSVKKITYCVESTINRKLFLPAGTFFDYENSYLMNFHAIIGYFESTINDPYTIFIKKNKELFGIGSLQKEISQDSLVDSIFALNYRELVDSPFLYSNFANKDTTSIQINNSRINIAIAPNMYNVDAQRIKQSIYPIVHLLQNDSLFSTLFKNSYSFLFCFSKNNLSYDGALEHNRSSVYYLSDTSNLQAYLIETVSHELLHLLTPLNLRSSVVDSFNFNNPAFSKHLWLYEGLTEYLSLKCNLNAHIIDTMTFFRQLQDKFVKGSNATIPSLLDFSENILLNNNQLQYDAIYTKGCLFAFYLDFIISKESNGKNGIFNLLDFALKSSSPNGIFSEKEFLAVLTKEFPEIEIAVQQSLIATNNIPFQDCLKYLGVAVKKSDIKQEKSNWHFGISRAIYKEQKKCIIVKNQPLNDSLEIKKIKILKINDSPITTKDLYTLLNPKSNNSIALTVKNKSQFNVLKLTPFFKPIEYFSTELTIENKENLVLKKILSFGLN